MGLRAVERLSPGSWLRRKIGLETRSFSERQGFAARTQMQEVAIMNSCTRPHKVLSCAAEMLQKKMLETRISQANVFILV